MPEDTDWSISKPKWKITRDFCRAGSSLLCYILAWKRPKQNERSEWPWPFLIVPHFYLSPPILHKAQHPIYPILWKNNISLSSLSLIRTVLLINTYILLLYSDQSLLPSTVSITTYTRADTLPGISGFNLRNPKKVSSFIRPQNWFLVHRVELKKSPENRPWRTRLYNKNNLSFRRWTLAPGEGWLVISDPRLLAVLVMATFPSQSAVLFSAEETLEDIPCRVSIWPYNRNPQLWDTQGVSGTWVERDTWPLVLCLPLLWFTGEFAYIPLNQDKS